MSPLPVEIVVKATALLALVGGLQLVIRHRASAAARHLIWTLAIGSVLVLPFASATLPRWNLDIPVTQPIAATPIVSALSNAIETSTPALLPAPEASLPANDRPTIAWPTLIVAIYAGGVLLLLIRLVLARLLLSRFARAARPVTDPTWQEMLSESARRMYCRVPVLLLQSATDTMPMTFGSSLRKATIVIPPAADEWTDDRRRAVLMHELAHVTRRDCLTQTMAAIACAFYWPHPGIWWATRRLRVEGELACDDLVLAAGAEARDYAGHLLEIARSFRVAPAIALGMARAPQLEGRLIAILDAARNRSTLRRAAALLVAAAALGVVVPVAVLNATIVPVNRTTIVADAYAPQTSSAPPQSTADSQAEMTGTWDVYLSGNTSAVQLTLRTTHSSHGHSLPLSRLDGLTAAQITGDGPVRFSSRRDAGTFTFDGVCGRGKCGGTYTFAPNAAFASELARRGIGTPTPAQMVRLAMSDAGLALVDELKSNGYATFDVAMFVEAVDHGVDLEYVRGMAGLGYRVGTVDALIRLRDHGVDPGYVRGMTTEGLPKVTADELVRLRDHGVDPQYVRGMKDAGQRSLSIDQLVTARDHGVDPKYSGELASLGYKDLTLDNLTRLRDHGVDSKYVGDLAALGYKALPLESLVKLRDHGVDPEYIRGLASLGYKDLPLDDLVRLRDHGVDPAYVRRLQERGAGHLSVDELIRRRDSGGDVDSYVQAIFGRVQSFWQSLVTRLRT